MILKPGKKKVLVISDTQCPFHHPDTISFLEWIDNKWGAFDEIVHLGDECDFHGVSRYIKDPDGYSAGHELQVSIDALKPIYELFPKVKVCTSNHVERPYDRAFEAGLPRSFLKDIKDVLEAPKGWEWADKWIIDDIAYIHGHGAFSASKTSIQQAAEKYSRSVVFGHVHAHAGIYYLGNEEELKFAMNAGSLINYKAYAFFYGKRMVAKPIIGCGIVNQGHPMFIPMYLNENGRWIKSKNKNKKLTSSYNLEFTVPKVYNKSIKCPKGHDETISKGHYKTKAGMKKVRFCLNCKKHFNILIGEFK